jgi:kynurenine formamidase
MMGEFPPYAKLPPAGPIAARHSWGVFGDADELGRVNLLTEARVVAACRQVKRGAVFNLCMPLTLPDPPWVEGRERLQHEIFAIDRNAQDDRLQNFYLQASTQWDGLRHIRARELGFYGGRQQDQAGPDGGELGIERWVQHGLVGRGVVVDVARRCEENGTPLSAREGTPITVEMLEDTLQAQGAALQAGDFCLLRTGYVAAYLAAAADEREDFAIERDCPGLHAGEEMAEYLWDHGVVAIAADNPAVEVVPGSPAVGSLHRRLIPLLGFVLGELFDFEALAEDCASDGRYTCLFVGVPLNLPGAVGSPGNAIALK